MFAPQASHICPPPGVSCTFVILPCGSRPPSSLRRMTKRTTSRSIKVFTSQNPGVPAPIAPRSRCDRLRPSRRHHPRPLWDCQRSGEAFLASAVLVIGLAVALAVSLVLAPLAAEARGVVQRETFWRADLAGLWEVIGGAVSVVGRLTKDQPVDWRSIVMSGWRRAMCRLSAAR